MIAPPKKEDVRPFMKITGILKEMNLRAPSIIASDAENGLLLLEDLGNASFTKVLAAEKHREAELYRKAVDALLHINRFPAPENVPPYSKELLMREVMLLPEWALPDNAEAAAEYREIWESLLDKISSRRSTLVLRDYHADNLMWLPDGEVGLLDYQDAVTGHPAYDLLSLLEDARRDVSPETASTMIKYFTAALPASEQDSFSEDYAILAAQRNCKIIGIFNRLSRRDGKNHYLSYLPRVFGHLERDLEHPALVALKEWRKKLRV